MSPGTEQVIKITVKPKQGQNVLAVIAEVQLLAGDIVRPGEGDQLIHYTFRPGFALTGWQARGFEIVQTEDVDVGPQRLARLLHDPERL